MSTDSDMTPTRDHVAFQLHPTLNDDSNLNIRSYYPALFNVRIVVQFCHVLVNM